MNEHPDVTVLVEFALGGLRAEASARVRQHCDTCDDCADQLAAALLLRGGAIRRRATRQRRALVVAASIVLAAGAAAFAALWGPGLANLATSETIPADLVAWLRGSAAPVAAGGNAGRCGLGVEALGAMRLDDAVGALEECVARDPGISNAHVALGIALYLHGDAARAIEYLEPAYRSEGDVLYDVAFWYLANAYLVAGRVDDAIDLVEEVREDFAPGDDDWVDRGFELYEQIQARR